MPISELVDSRGLWAQTGRGEVVGTTLVSSKRLVWLLEEG